MRCCGRIWTLRRSRVRPHGEPDVCPHRVGVHPLGRNNAHVHVLGVLQAAVEAVPFAVSGLDFDNGSEFLNHAVIAWAAQTDIYFTRSWPYKKNDQATIESKNNHLVRRYSLYYRYDTPEELRVLNRLWPLVNDRFNFLTLSCFSTRDQLRALWDPYSWVSGGSLDPGFLHLGRRIVASGPPRHRTPPGLLTVRIPRRQPPPIGGWP